MSIEVNPDEDFHVVINGNVLALSLDALSAAYEGEVVREESLIWQPGLIEWMRLDVVLQHLEQQEPQAAEAPDFDSETYYVQVSEDEVKQMSLDQLDTAYRVDIIDSSTLVWQPGYTEWVPLAVLIGDEAEQNHYSVAPSMPAPRPAQAVHSQYPAAVAAQVAPAPSFSAFPQASPQANSYQQLSSAAPFYSSAPSFAPVSRPSAAPNSLSAVAVATSYIPEIPGPAPKASSWYGRSLIAAAALVTLGVAHRHGAGYELASSLDGSSTQKVWAARAGEPARDTPYGLERWLGQVEAKYGLNSLSSTDAIPAARPSAGLSALAAALPTISQSSVESTPSVGSTPSTETKPENSAKPASASAASAFGAALSNQPATARASASPQKYRAASKKPARAMKGGNAYDPMNGAL